MRKVVLLVALFIVVPLVAKVTVSCLRVENMNCPLGIDTDVPRFSWTIDSDSKDVRQMAYEIVVESDGEELWKSGRVESDRQLWIPYRGIRLKSNQHCSWKVRVFTNKGVSEWNATGRFSTGLLGETYWSGRWIGLEQMVTDEHGGLHPRLAARYLRKEFSLKKPVMRATAFVCGLGLYELHVNGRKIGSDVLTPIASDYRKTVYYNTYDVTSVLCENNCVGIILGNGRYFAYRQNKPYKNTQFGFPKCRINIIVEYSDGTTERISTDEKWKLTTDGAVRRNNEYDGETYDAGKELVGWDMAGFDDSSWMSAERTAVPSGTLRAQMSPSMNAEKLTNPIRRVSANVIDCGQNVAGWLSFVPKGKPGDTVRIRYAERLDGDGRLYTANLRSAQSEDIYVCNGHDREWHPRFVTHGFRYVEILGMDIANVDFSVYAVGDRMATAGTFVCSDTILNKVVRNAYWGIRSNYKGLPVDCPQRDERQPWLGDRTVGSLGESFVFDNERLYTKWMRDICESQREDGCIPDVAPAYWNYYTDDVTWPAALPFTCDMLLRQYGNDEAVRLWYPNMRHWILHIIGRYSSKDGLITKDKYGDWCVPPEKPWLIHSQDPARNTDGSLIATAYTIRCLQLLTEFARMSGFNDDASEYVEKEKALVAAFNKRFLTCKSNTSPRPGHPLYPDSVYYGNNTATANLLALAFGIAPDSIRMEIAKQVVENIVVRNKEHVSCGVIGISWLLRTLSDNGYSDVAYKIATNKTYPSWGYMAEQGATTIWELWNGDTADPAMNSANHVMLLGDLLTWCFQYIGGIRQSDSGYKHIILKPDFGIRNCDHADVSFNSPYGLILSRWKKSLQHLEWEVKIPCNTSAQIILPDGTIKSVGSGEYHFSVDIPTDDRRILKNEFLYTDAPIPSAHASTIVETKKGDVVVAYFGGTYERNPDCKIWVSRKPKGSDAWQPPFVATPTLENEKDTACWNPVLFEMPDGELWLFYKRGTSVGTWTGWLTRSRDGGKTWSRREALPEGFLGPVKNKPVIVGDYLVCGSSTEADGWRFHVELYNLKTKEWKYVGPIESTIATKTDDNHPHPIDCIQPSILLLSDGRLQVLMRTHNARLATSFSSDGGLTWTPVVLSEVENNQSGTDAVTLRDGRHVLIYNNFETLPNTKKGPRTPLSIAVSDDGTHWRHALTLEDSPVGQYSYPAIIEGRDGKLHCVYTWQRLRIAYKQIDAKNL